MKNIIKTIVWLCLLPLPFSCATEDILEPDQNRIPKASEFQISHTIDETNIVTFHLANSGMVPLWIFGENDQLSGDGAQRRFAAAGDYTVEVKAYNQHGVSDASQVYTFNVPTTWVPPFDPAPLLSALSGGGTKTWVLDSDTPGHLGCGENAANPAGWWSANPGEKADFSVYDDQLTFGADYSYVYDPVDGYTYVNYGAGYHSELYAGDEQDYVAPVDRQETTFQIECDDDGNVFIVLPAQTFFSYLPNAESYANPRLQVISYSSKKLVLVSSTPGISWQYIFKPYDPNAGTVDTESVLTGGSSRTWRIATAEKGHLGCGENVASAAGWWSADPFDKADWGVYDDRITFNADGSYVYDPGADGMAYVNKESGYHSELYLGDDQDYDAPAERQEATWTLGDDGNYEFITLPAGVFFSYVPNAEVLSSESTLYITNITKDKITLVWNSPTSGIAWQYIFAPYDPADDVAWDVEGATNLWRNASGYSMTYWYADASWTQIADPETESLDEFGGLKVTVPETGGSEWQGQTVFHLAGVPVSAAKQYDFCVTVNADRDIPAMTVKLAWEGNDQDHSMFYVNNFSAAGGEAATFRYVGASPDTDYDTVALFIDLGRCEPGTVVTFTDFCLQEHK